MDEYSDRVYVVHTWSAEQGPLPQWAHPGSEVVGSEAKQLREKHAGAGLH